jgi:hypothetical protein
MYNLTKLRLLFRAITRLQIRRAILDIKLNADLIAQISGAAVQASGLHAGDVGHDFELGIETRAAIGTEEMLVDFAGGSCGIIRLWCS